MKALSVNMTPTMPHVCGQRERPEVTLKLPREASSVGPILIYLTYSDSAPHKVASSHLLKLRHSN